MKVVKKWL